MDETRSVTTPALNKTDRQQRTAQKERNEDQKRHCRVKASHQTESERLETDNDQQQTEAGRGPVLRRRLPVEKKDMSPQMDKQPRDAEKAGESSLSMPDLYLHDGPHSVALKRNILHPFLAA